MSYPIFDFLRWMLLGPVGYAFMSCCQFEHFGGYL